MKVRIYLKSGNVIESKMDKVKWTQHSETGQFTKLEWEKPAEGVRLQAIDLSAIEAIATES